MALSRRFVKQPSFQGVAAGQTAVINLPNAGTYFGLKFFYGTATAGGANQVNMETELTRIRLKLNGVTQREFSARELFDINAFHGIDFETGILNIFFAEPWRPEIIGEDALSWGMGGVQTFTAEVDIASGATSPTLRATALWSPVTTNTNLINQWRRHTVQPSAAGEYDFLPPKNGSYYAAHFDMSSVTINGAKVKVDQDVIFDGAKADVDSAYRDHHFDPQNDYFHIALDKLTGRASESLPMVKPDGSMIADFRITLDAAGGGNIPVITEVLAPRAA